ncbi:MAG TPA: serine hydrolase domain-containing protein [Dehalococcoidia bacterium]|nr:serine hydrolase domain-containing protein [Dehalococcoidia bacterium]
MSAADQPAEAAARWWPCKTCSTNWRWWRTLTLRHLLTHTGGFFGDRFEDHGADAGALARAVAGFGTLRQYAPPGAVWAYCNLGFQLAGRIAEVVLGQPFETAVRARVFAPLGMEHSFYFADEAITFPLAAGHNLLPDGTNEVAHVWARARCRAPQGGVTSCVGDLLRFAAPHLGDGASDDGRRVLSPESVRLMQTPLVEATEPPHWGLGWSLDSMDGGAAWVGHGGVTNGFQAQLSLLPEHGFAFAALSNGNQGGAVIRAIEAWLLDRCLGLRRREPREIALAEAELAPLAGSYDGPLARYTLSVASGGLRIEEDRLNPFTGTRSPVAPAQARPIGPRRFRILDGAQAGAIFDFLGGRAAQPRWLRMNNRLADRIA